MSEQQIGAKVSELTQTATAWLNSTTATGRAVLSKIVADYRAVLTVSALVGTIVPAYHIVSTEFWTFALAGTFGVTFIKLGGFKVLMPNKADVPTGEMEDA